MPVARFIIVDDGTIAQSRDDRPLKRPRIDDDQGRENSEVNCPATTSGPVVRDPDFYSERPSADCIVQVQNTMFKVGNSVAFC